MVLFAGLFGRFWGVLGNVSRKVLGGLAIFGRDESLIWCCSVDVVGVGLHVVLLTAGT